MSNLIRMRRCYGRCWTLFETLGDRKLNKWFKINYGEGLSRKVISIPLLDIHLLFCWATVKFGIFFVVCVFLTC